MTETSSSRSGKKKSSKATPKAPVAIQAKTDPQTEVRALDFDEALRLLRRGAPYLGLFITVVIAFTLGVAPALLVLSAFVLLLAISVIWSSLQAVAGFVPESGSDLLEISIEGAEDEQKQFLLRALKDLEFERSLGKISEDDYEELKRVYRAQAKEALRAADAASEPARSQAEALVKAHLENKGIQSAHVSKTVSSETPDDKPAAQAEKPKDEEKAQEPASSKCSACETINDVDAVFCKKCGNRLNAEKSADGGPTP
jgi:hypothetical protein